MAPAKQKSKTLLYIFQFLALSGVLVGGVSLASTFASTMRRKKAEEEAEEAKEDVKEAEKMTEEVVEKFAGTNGYGDRAEDLDFVGEYEQDLDFTGNGDTERRRTRFWQSGYGQPIITPRPKHAPSEEMTNQRLEEVSNVAARNIWHTN